MKSFPLLKSETFRLFLISFAILFWELVCIRWIAAYVLYLGYFTNFVLLGALLGIGAGSLLARRQLGDRPSRLLIRLPVLMFGFFALVLLTRTQLQPGATQYIFFTTTQGAVQLPPYILLPLIFLGVTAIFTALAQDLGLLLEHFPPLQGYNLNILGSLAGIAAFTILSWLSTPAWVWFAVGSLALLLLLIPKHAAGRAAFLLGGLVLILVVSDAAFLNVWSPYYRINLLQVATDGVSRVDPNSAVRGSYVLNVNGAEHQAMGPATEIGSFYGRPYTSFATSPIYNEVLIIGAGTGNDVATAIAHGARHIDAVEIDPQIIELGRRFHPDNPYANSNVTVYVDDARAFLEKTDKQYDLVVFALPDSLVLASSFGSVRLESYLFTEEAFASVKRHLKPDGLLVLYNYYREEWLINKLLFMLRDVFGEPVAFHQSVQQQQSTANFASMFAGARVAVIDQTQPGFAQRPNEPFVPATDNWPFLYMHEPSLPVMYGLTLILIVVFAAVYIGRLAPRGTLSDRHHWPFFFMGAAFALLETRSIVQLLLLFGSTWLVNSLAFFAILSVVLAANWLAARFRVKRLNWLFVLLFATLALNYLLPIKTLLIDPPVLRYALAIALLFSPIFCANLIYSNLFRDTPQPSTAFGANLLGAMIGGAAEYLALYLGYQNLMIFAGIFYALAFFVFFRLYRRANTVAIQ
jgi:SAM-dependent methyltransferase